MAAGPLEVVALSMAAQALLASALGATVEPETAQATVHRESELKAACPVSEVSLYDCRQNIGKTR